MPITRSDGFVVQTGDPDPEGDIHDFFLPGSKDVRERMDQASNRIFVIVSLGSSASSLMFENI